MPDFGIKAALSEFGKAVEGKRFQHPDTSNQVLYTSLPKEERRRIYEQWQKQSLIQESTESADKSEDPFAGRKGWPAVDLEDLYQQDVVAYQHKGKDRIGVVSRISEDGSQFWVQEVDPDSGKLKSNTERSFDQAKIDNRDARLVDENLWDDVEDGFQVPSWEGVQSPHKKHTPAGKEKFKEDHKAQEAARKKAVKAMGAKGKPVKDPKEVKIGDVVSYQWKGDVYHGRVIDARGHEFFTIDIDPDTGALKEHGFEEWRGHGITQSDLHKVDAKHVPDDPAEENEKALYEGLPTLEEDHKKYFRDDKNAELVDLSKIKPAKVRLKGVLNGNDLLAQAAKGKWGKRKPISLTANGDGSYTVRDGNSTFKNAELSGWGKIPAVIKTEEEWKEHDRKEEERKKQQTNFPAYGGAPYVTKEEAPKKKPKSFKGDALESVGDLSKGDLFGYEHEGRWYVGRVARMGNGDEIRVDSLHPDNGKLTTLKYIRFDGKKLKDAKAVRLKDDHRFPKKKKKAPKMPHKKNPKSKGKSDPRGKPFTFASKAAAAEEMRTLLADIRNAYRPRWQDTPGYKTVVDVDSDKGIYPAQTESTSPDRGQGNMDSTWPVQPPQSREKERALPLPSNHSKGREKYIGPTVINKPRKVPDRTLSVPGEEYGHPTKYDYNMPTRRVDGPTAFEDDDTYEEDPIDDQLESVANDGRQGPFPSQHQKNQGGPARLRSKQWYMRNPAKRREEKHEYQMRGKRLPREKLKKKYYRMYPHRFKRRGIGFTTPAERTKAWREENKREDERKGISHRKKREKAKEKARKERFEKQGGVELLAEAFEMLGIDFSAANWPVDWNTQTKKTNPPSQLDQNYGPGQSRDTGTPRKDPGKQQGESLRAPNLHDKHQKGLFTQNSPPAAGAINTPTTNNPTDGSGKVLPMSYYTDFVNNTQSVPDGRQDRYERNNNFDVKQATNDFIGQLCRPEFGKGDRSSFGPDGGQRRVAFTVGELFKRVDKKIKVRSKEYTPKLARTDTKNWIWHWNVGDYAVRVQAFKRGNATSFPKLNIRVSCSCPFWQWWGPAHWAERSDYQRGKAPGTATYPKVRDPARWKPVCKHAYAVLEKSMSFFVRPQKSPLRKLGSRFSVDSLDAIEVVVEHQDIVARVARKAVERDLARKIARRYVEGKES